jgi:hypothetical protein
MRRRERCMGLWFHDGCLDLPCKKVLEWIIMNDFFHWKFNSIQLNQIVAENNFRRIGNVNFGVVVGKILMRRIFNGIYLVRFGFWMWGDIDFDWYCVTSY